MNLFSTALFHHKIIGLEQFHNNNHWGLHLNFFCYAWSDHLRPQKNEVAAVARGTRQAKRHKYNALHSFASNKKWLLIKRIALIFEAKRKALMDGKRDEAKSIGVIIFNTLLQFLFTHLVAEGEGTWYTSFLCRTVYSFLLLFTVKSSL